MSINEGEDSTTQGASVPPAEAKDPSPSGQNAEPSSIKTGGPSQEIQSPAAQASGAAAAPAKASTPATPEPVSAQDGGNLPGGAGNPAPQQDPASRVEGSAPQASSSSAQGSGAAAAPGKVPALPPTQPTPTPTANATDGKSEGTPAAPTLKVLPATVELSAGDVQAFSVDPANTRVKWELMPPDAGKISATGAYWAPKNITRPRSVIVTAVSADRSQYGVSTITLSDTPSKISLVGWYGVVVAVYLGVILLLLWSFMSAPAPQHMIVVSPPIVTLDATKEEQIQFTAKVLDDPEDSVTWSAPPNQKI